MRHVLRVSASVVLVVVAFGRGGTTHNRVFARQGSDSKSSILVNPKSNGNGTAGTIQEAIDRVSPGGKVLVLPGTYNETLTITKGLTLQAIGGASGAVIIAPTATPDSVIEIATSEPVTLRDLTVHVPGASGIRGVGHVDVRVEHSAIVAPNPLAAPSSLVTVTNELLDGSRSRMVVRDSFVDGFMTATPIGQSFLLRTQGDVDAVIERNVLRRSGGACVFIVTRSDLGGETNAEILDNDFDECHPVGRVAAILVGPVATNLPSATRPLTATGTVNIIGNRFSNSLNFCLNSAIAFEVGSGRIEHNVINDFVKPCVAPMPRNRPSAIWLGRVSAFPFPPVTPTVRFNDLRGNAQAGLRIGSNQTVATDASCNYWGSESGPSGIGAGSGDAVIVDPGGAPPLFVPFSPEPIARSNATGC